MPHSTAERSRTRGRLPLYWVGISALAAAVDFVCGPFVQFPIVYGIPVGLAAWFSGVRFALGLAVLLPLVRLYFVTLWAIPWEFGYSVMNAAIRIVVFGALAIMLDRIARQREELANRVESLEGLLPICSGCKRIRDEEQRWQPLETYIGARTGAEFTHGMCPPCARQYFGEFAAEE